MIAMISQPMGGRTDEEIRNVKDAATKVLENLDYEVEDTYFSADWYIANNERESGTVNVPLYFLAKSIEKMSVCDAVYFVDGWENARGCQIEHDIAYKYGLKILYEDSHTTI